MCTVHTLITQAGGYADMERTCVELYNASRRKRSRFNYVLYWMSCRGFFVSGDALGLTWSCDALKLQKTLTALGNLDLPLRKEHTGKLHGMPMR